MVSKSMLNAIEQGAREIEHLRRANELLAVQVRVIDVFEMALAQSGRKSQSSGEDIAWRLRELIKHLEKDSADARPVED